MAHLLLILLAWCLPAGSQVPWQTCTRCHATGKLPCPKHKAAECAFEDDVVY